MASYVLACNSLALYMIGGAHHGIMSIGEGQYCITSICGGDRQGPRGLQHVVYNLPETQHKFCKHIENNDMSRVLDIGVLVGLDGCCNLLLTAQSWE